MTVHDFLPDEQLCAVRNLPDFLGVFVFDKWTCNTNGGRQFFFVRRKTTVVQPRAPRPAGVRRPSRIRISIQP